MKVTSHQNCRLQNLTGRVWFQHGSFLFMLVVAVLLAYSNNFTSEFVYDDYPFILENPAVRSLSHPARFFTDRDSFSHHGEYVIYRPLATLSFAVNYAIGGYRPAWYHAVNIALHTVCGLLVYVFFFSTFGRKTYAFFAALIFLLHPVQTEAVSWIAARGNPLFLIFLLLSVLAYRKWTINPREGRPFYALALGFAILSLLSKEMAVVLPVLLLVYDGTVNRPSRSEFWKLRIPAIAPFFVLSLLYVLLRYMVLGVTRQIGYWGGSLWTSLLVMTKAFAYYVRLMFMPRPLMVEYVVPLPHSLLQPTVVVSILVLGAIAVLWAFSLRRNTVLAFGIAWFFASLLPVSNIIPLRAIINERFLYLPSLGFCAILASPLLVVRRDSRLMFRTAVVGLTMIAMGYGVLTFNRNRDWRDSLSLWTASVKASPAGTTSQYNLGLELFKRKRYDEAIEHLKIACRFQEHFPSAHGALGNAYLAKGDTEAAIREYEIGLFQAPDDTRMQHNLAVAWFEKGNAYAGRRENAQAARCFLKALQYEPAFAPAQEKLHGLMRATQSESPGESNS